MHWAKYWYNCKWFLFSLARPVFIYVNNDEYSSRPEIAAFIEFFLTDGTQYVDEVGYVPIGDANYEKELEKISQLLP